MSEYFYEYKSESVQPKPPEEEARASSFFLSQFIRVFEESHIFENAFTLTFTLTTR